MSDNKPHSEEENDFDDANYFEEEIVSKSELKRQSEELQKMGETLVGLSAAHLETIPLDDELQDAVLTARKINKKKDGYRRQLQFIGKLMRQRDVADIQEALDRIANRHQQANAEFHALEKAREAVIRDGDSAIQNLIEEHPQLDRQKLRQFHRQVKKEQEKNAPPKAFRELFQYLKEEIHEQN